MKKLYFLLLAFSFFTTANAQIVNIPDANFKTRLLTANTTNSIAKNLSGVFFKIDANNDGQIQESEALNVSYLDVSSDNPNVQKISDLTGIQSFNNLKSLSCSYNKLTSLNVSPLVNLTVLYCSANQLTSINLSGLINLQTLHCSYNQVSSLNVSPLVNLTILYCGDNQLTSLNLSGSTNLQTLHCSYNKLTSLNLAGLTKLFSFYCENNLITTLDLSILKNLSGEVFVSQNKLEILYIKNGKNNDYLGFSGNPTLKYICVDDNELTSIQSSVNRLGYTNCQVNSYCSFVPGGTFYTIQGNQKLDSNKNGCDANDIIMPNLKYNITNGSISGSLIPDTSGDYSIAVQAGTHTITPV